MSKKIWLTGIVVLLLAVSTGCGQKAMEATGSTANDNTNGGLHSSVESPATSGENATVSPTNSNGSNDGSDSSEPSAKNSLEIVTNYTDAEMQELINVSSTISYQSEDEKYTLALQKLQEAPSGDLYSLWEKVKFQKVLFQNGLVTVDILLPSEARLGSGGEVLALESLKNTLFQFAEVDAIELLVEGEPADTLMGHVELDHPIPRN